MAHSSLRRRLLTIVAAATVATGALSVHAQAYAATDAAIDLQVLVVDDGTPTLEAITDRMDVEGVPYTAVNLNDGARPAITSDFLTDATSTRPHAKFQGVVLGTHTPAGLSDAEIGALDKFERDFGIREFSAYNWPSAATGYAGTPVGTKLDGATGQVTTAAKKAGFGSLAGKVPFDDIDPAVSESYGYLANPATNLPAGSTFTPFLTTTVGGTSGVLLGEYDVDGKQELVSTMAINKYQQHTAALAPGIIEWLTRGVHLGMNRNYFSIHADDVFLPNTLWQKDGNCTAGDLGCDPVKYPVERNEVRMTSSDVDRLVKWQSAKGMHIALAFNGDGVADQKEATGGKDALYDKLLANKSKFNWINHTYSHEYLGCVKDESVDPWQCARTADGSVDMASQSLIDSQIRQNVQFAQVNGLPNFDRHELVTGEHSGLKSLPQMPDDNPNLAPALAANDIAWIASDNSRESAQRSVGDAQTVPRYPMNIYYNVSTKSQEIDEYNWAYTSRADGGSGVCEDNPDTTTCIKPLDPKSGFDSYIVPLEARIALHHMTTNDPRPHYAHQSNLAGDGVLYPVLNKMLEQYRNLYAANTPVVEPSMSQTGVELQRRRGWASHGATATLVGRKITVSNGSGERFVPLTAPSGTTSGGASWGASYSGAQSQWSRLDDGAALTLDLVNAPGYHAPTGAVSPAAAFAPTPKQPKLAVFATPEATGRIGK